MDFFREILRFFIAKEYSFASKFISLLVVLFAVLFIDNILGFSFYYANNQKINQLKTIGTLQKENTNNTEMSTMLSEIQDDIINRKNILEGFFELFSKDNFDNNNSASKITVDTFYVVKCDTIRIPQKVPYFPWNQNAQFLYDSLDQKTPFYSKNMDSLARIIAYNDSRVDMQKLAKSPITIQKSRSKLWHTLSSSYGFIFLMIILPIIPFTESSFDWNTMIGMLLFMILIAGIIWLNQFLLGLIPLILNNPLINYGINFSIQLIISIFLFRFLEKRGNE